MCRGFRFCRYAVAAQMLLGLRRYFIADTSQADQNIRRAKKVKTRKGRKSTEDETEGLLVTPFSFKEVIGTKYFGQLELMVSGRNPGEHGLSSICRPAFGSMRHLLATLPPGIIRPHLSSPRTS